MLRIVTLDEALQPERNSQKLPQFTSQLCDLMAASQRIATTKFTGSFHTSRHLHTLRPGIGRGPGDGDRMRMLRIVTLDEALQRQLDSLTFPQFTSELRDLMTGGNE